MMDIYFILVHFQNHRMHNTKKTKGSFNLEKYCWLESALHSHETLVLTVILPLTSFVTLGKSLTSVDLNFLFCIK